MEPLRVGIVGCGAISSIYFEAQKKFDALKIVAAADLNRARAEAQAAKFDVPKVLTVEELLADPEVDAVLNLTIPNAHFSVCRDGLLAGKHVYVEKPLSITREEGNQLLALAAERGLRVGGAPDTFLGGGIQTCRKLTDEGAIGVPVAAAGNMLCHGHESWHPDPEFYYKVGGGPLFDMGPYYLTALVNLLGPIASISGSAKITWPERTITSAPKNGSKITVDTPTHVSGVMEFASGVIASLTTSFDVWYAQTTPIEIYGSEGTLSVPDPNGFGGRVRMRIKGDSEWRDMPLTHGHDGNGRGIGLADMAVGIANKRPHRASGELANHVLEAMHGFLQSADDRRHYMMTTKPAQPAPLPNGWPETE